MKVTHQELIERCNRAGLKVTKITRQYAYMDEYESADKVHVSLDWKDVDGHTVREIVTFHENPRIRLIRVIRFVTGLSLYDARRVMESQWVRLVNEAKKG